MESETVERVVPGTVSWDQYGAEHMQRYAFFSAYYKGRHVVDAACGTGYGTAFIAQSEAASARGYDISRDAINFSLSHYHAKNLSYHLQDLAALEQVKEKADLVVSFETIEHLNDPEKFIKSVAGILNSGGKFICSTPNKKRLSGSGHINPYHPSELEWEDFKKIFEKYFEVNECFHQSESTEYLRYLELKHLLHQQDMKMQALLFNRLEIKLRKIFRKKFRPIPFIHGNLMNQHRGDVVIEPLVKPENWHKTFIITGTVR